MSVHVEPEWLWYSLGCQTQAKLASQSTQVNWSENTGQLFVLGKDQDVEGR